MNRLHSVLQFVLYVAVLTLAAGCSEKRSVAPISNGQPSAVDSGTNDGTAPAEPAEPETSAE